MSTARNGASPVSKKAAQQADTCIGPGVFVPVVGPSGSGKDSLIGYASSRLADRPDICFARRVVTRPCDPAAESHDTLDAESFERAKAAGAFALSWSSHGLGYGIPLAVDDTIRAGGVVIANTSRGLIGEIERRYRTVVPVLVTVSPQVLAARLAARGRESADEIAARIARNAGYEGFGEQCRIIDNSGALEQAGERLLQLIIEIMPHHTT